MKRGLGLSSKEIGEILAKWNKGVLDSFLIQITSEIMFYDDDDGVALVEKILDKAGQKGTGKWAAVNAFNLGMPVTLIAESVMARYLSAMKVERVEASTKLQYVSRNSGKFEGDKEQFLADLEQALYASKITSYTQGFMLMQDVCVHMNLAWFVIVSWTFVDCAHRPRKSSTGNSTYHPSLSCGAEVVSFSPSS